MEKINTNVVTHESRDRGWWDRVLEVVSPEGGKMAYLGKGFVWWTRGRKNLWRTIKSGSKLVLLEDYKLATSVLKDIQAINRCFVMKGFICVLRLSLFDVASGKFVDDTL